MSNNNIENEINKYRPKTRRHITNKKTGQITSLPRFSKGSKHFNNIRKILAIK